jgi:voltage-gated potassium channel
MAEHVIHRKNNFLYLVLSLFALMAVAAVSTLIPEGEADIFLVSIFLLTLAVAYASLNFGNVWRNVVLFLLAGVLIDFLFKQFVLVEGQKSNLYTAVILLLFFLGEAHQAGKSIIQSLSKRQVDTNMLTATLALYLLIGLIYAMLYLILMEFNAGALKGIEYAQGGDMFVTAIYFSFVTMTSLGYGDISPTGPVGQIMVIIEAITGTFYMAVIVATMVATLIGNQISADENAFLEQEEKDNGQ